MAQQGNKLNKEVFDHLVHMVATREKIRVKKNAGEPTPWSNDEILNNYRFTNVFREHDKITIGIRKIYGNNFNVKKHGKKFWVNFAMARVFNNLDTLESMGTFDGNVENWKNYSKLARKCLLELNRKGIRMYNPAYIIRGIKGETKSETYFKSFSKMARSKKQPAYNDISGWSEFLISFPMIGEFMANQIICDMKYFYPEMRESKEFNTYVLAGPGTIRGLKWLFGESLPGNKIPKALMYIHKKLAKIFDFYCDGYDYFADPNTTANCLCEFDKYMRKLSGKGKPKQRYVQSND